MKKIALLLFAVLIGLVVYGSLRSKKMPPADFTAHYIDSLKTLDPAGMHWHDEITTALALWEGLATYQPDSLVPISGVAKLPAKISDGGLTYLFELRSDARWSNGDPVKASDFVYGWRRAIEPGTAGVYVALITDHIAGAKAYSQWRNDAVGTLLELKGSHNESFESFRKKHLSEMDEAFAQVGIKALNDHHLEVRLTRPISYFSDLVAFATFTPIHEASIELLRDQDETLTLWSYDSQWVKPDYHRNGYPGLVTNGAFRLSDWQFKRYMAFEKNPYYWDKDQVKSQKFVVRIINDPGAAFLAYEKGDIDLHTNIVTLDFAPALVEQKQKGLRDDIHVTPAFGNYFYRFNCQDTLPDGRDNPFKDARVRMALNLAVDKQSIVDNVRKTGNPVALNFIPPDSIPGYRCASGPEYNLDRAKELLAQAGYPNGVGLPTIEILYNSGGGHESPAQAIAEMWRENLGISTSLKGKEVKSYDADKKSMNFMVLRASWFGDYTDPTTFLDLLDSKNGNNDGKFSSPEFDGFLAQAAQCLDPIKRMGFLSDAENLLLQKEMPILPIYYYVMISAFRDNLKGVVPNSRDRYMYKYIYVEDED